MDQDKDMWNNIIKTCSDFLQNIVTDINNLRTDINIESDLLQIEPNLTIKNNNNNHIHQDIKFINSKCLISYKNKQNLQIIISIQKILFKLSNDSLSKYDRLLFIKKTLFLIDKLVENDKNIFTYNHFNIHSDLNFNLDSNAIDAIRLLQIFDDLIDYIIKSDANIEQPNT